VISVTRLGARRGPITHQPPARVTIDLGEPPAYVVPLELAASAGAPVAPLLAAIRDPRKPPSEDDVAKAVFSLLASVPGANAQLATALGALGATVFPRAGERLDASLPEGSFERRSVFADGVPAGVVIRVVEPGLLRAGRVLRPAKVEVSAGPMSKALRTLTQIDAAQDLSPELRSLVAPLLARLAALPEDKHDSEDGDKILVEALAALDGRRSPLAEQVTAHLRERGYVVAPDGPGGSLETLKAILGSEGALEAPRKRFGSWAPGEIVAVERRAVFKGELVLSKARVTVCVGGSNELHGIVSDVRAKLEQEAAETSALAELDEVLDRIAEAKPDRLHFLAFPVANVLHRLSARERLGSALKAYLRGKNVREVTAYAGYPAAELGPKKLEEVRVSSEREKGKIVRVLRPGFEDEKTGVVLQKVQAEVSR
jgi:molecular chaperone GrpE (heat shock protein)